MSRWFRVYDDLLDDPKVQQLSPDLFKFLIGLWCVSSKFAGRLPNVSDLAFRMRMQPRRVERMVKELIIAELIDETSEGLTPHNWDVRQRKSDTSNERVKRYRERKCNVTETPLDTDTDTDKKETPKSPRGPRPKKDLWPFDVWLAAYPRPEAPKHAEKAFRKVEASGEVSFEDLLAAAKAYAVEKAGVEKKFIRLPATWLNGGCWMDGRAAATTNGQEDPAERRAKIREWQLKTYGKTNIEEEPNARH